MKQDKRDLERLVASAMTEGLPGDDPSGADLSDLRHSQFERIGKALKTAHFEAPPEALGAAKALMPEVRRQVWARLVSGGMALAGARSSTAESFQLVFEAEEARARLMYERDSQGWQVAGQAPKGFRVQRGGRGVRVDAEGRFVFRAKDLADTGLTLLEEGLEVIIPSADKVDDSRSPR